MIKKDTLRHALSSLKQQLRAGCSDHVSYNWPHLNLCCHGHVHHHRLQSDREIRGLYQHVSRNYIFVSIPATAEIERGLFVKMNKQHKNTKCWVKNSSHQPKHKFPTQMQEKYIYENVLTHRGRGSTTLYHSQYRTCFRMSVGQFWALVLMLVPRLRRQGGIL